MHKRIKRQVTSRIQDFFVMTAPGFEGLALYELMGLPLTRKDARLVIGGIEFKGRLQDCYLANLMLRTAGRILMRVTGFKASNFSSLERKLGQTPWELYLRPGQSFKFHVTTRKSRLYHKKALEERFRASISGCLAGSTWVPDHETGEPPVQDIFVRFVNDRCTVSLDSSGANLHKRGIKKHKAAAPMRETMAAGILYWAGFHGQMPLLDPMCGSGTFSLEAAMITKHLPPGWFRPFSFEHWPAFSPRAWAHMKKECGQHVVPTHGHRKCRVYASDLDQDTCESLEKIVKTFGFDDLIRVQHRDFFSVMPGDWLDKKGVVVMNPPYGRRLETKNEGRSLYEEIARKLARDFKGWRLALVVPEKNMIKNIPFPPRLKALALPHGGLKPYLLVGQID